ncbi:MAG: MFS transporter [Planctomycetes bacterium]|nr:MFS transporter [Planctomycetota bacterium]
MKSNLLKRGFVSLLFTQFFGAANDNILKGLITYMVIDGAWAGRLGTGGQGVVGLCFTLPFILLSGYAGQFADRNSKRYVSVLVKVLEIPIALVALAGFWTGNLWLTLASLVALTCQSAFFSPAKYGMIPEIVDRADLSRANGTITMMTNIAVIAGTFAAGALSDRYSPLSAAGGPSPHAILWLPGAALLLVALAGLVSVLFLKRLEPGDRDLRYQWNPFATYIATLPRMARSPLLMVALAWGYFYLLAGLALLIVPEYTTVLGINRKEASGLLGVLALAIGGGSAIAGLISGRRIEPRLVPVGAFGITVFFVLLGVVRPNYWGVAGLIFGAGFFAGFYIIPLQALLQKLSPDDERGRFLGTANGISFAFLSVASALYAIIRPSFGDAPQRIFLVSAALMLVGAGYFLFRLRHMLRARH